VCVAQVTEHLSSKHKALTSKLQYHQKEKKREEVLVSKCGNLEMKISRWMRLALQMKEGMYIMDVFCR
jgi:hypothetical protein